MFFKIADFNIKLKNVYDGVERFLPEYCVTDVEPDLIFETEFKDLQSEVKVDLNNYKDTPAPYLEFITLHRKLAECLPDNNAFLLHSATFDVDGVGVAFAAHSGTGKTTHMMLWQKLLGDKMTIVNGDKPIVRFFDDEPETPYAYGTPWNGKEILGCNMRTPLKHICFIERSITNSVEPMQKSDVVDLIFNQVYMPKDPMAAMNTMQLIDRLLSCCKLWKIKCNMNPEAAEVAYNTIFNNN